jgi:hypothetical protein
MRAFASSYFIAAQYQAFGFFSPQLRINLPYAARRAANLRLSRHVWRKALRPEDRTMDEPKQERRNEARHRALKGARIVFKRHDALIDCTVSTMVTAGMAGPALAAFLAWFWSLPS